MIYKNKDIPDNFNKIAEVGDNFIVFVKESKLNSDTDYQAYIQYFNPSWAYFYTTTYRIKQHDHINMDINYDNSGMYSYLDSIITSSSLNTYQVSTDYISKEEASRFDTITLFIGQILCCVCILWVFKQLSRLFFKGGLY